MQANFVDFHAHLDLYSNFEEVAKECENKKIYTLAVTTTPRAWEVNNKTYINMKYVRPALGFHPQLISDRYKEIELFESLVPQTKYIGEIGLDGSNEHKESFNIQVKIFRRILSIIKRHGGKIMSIHSKDSVSFVLDELQKAEGVPILHWFSGSKIELDKAIRQGCWFSISPSMINSTKGSNLISSIPRERILTETDGPFTQYNRSSLMPWDVKIIFPKLAKIWNIPDIEAKHKVYLNFKSLINISRRTN